MSWGNRLLIQPSTSQATYENRQVLLPTSLLGSEAIQVTRSHPPHVLHQVV
jgi:hypothetical protein